MGEYGSVKTLILAYFMQGKKLILPLHKIFENTSFHRPKFSQGQIVLKDRKYLEISVKQVRKKLRESKPQIRKVFPILNLLLHPNSHVRMY